MYQIDGQPSAWQRTHRWTRPAGAGRTRRRYHRQHGSHPNLYYTYGRGWYGSVRLPGGFRVGHKL